MNKSTRVSAVTSRRNYWLIWAGKDAEQEETIIQNRIAAVGWIDIRQDLGLAKSKAELRTVYASAYPTKSVGVVTRDVDQIWTFLHELAVGDVVITPLQKRKGAIFVGEVAGEYRYRRDLGLAPHTRPLTGFRLDISRDDLPIDARPALRGMRGKTLRRLTNEPLVLILERQRIADPPAILETDEWIDKILVQIRKTLFDPHQVQDDREHTLRAIAQRQGQPTFRRCLLDAYAHRCAVTECDAEDVLEAAHIYPYRGGMTNDVRNGLLLRSDVHTLFDRYLLTINPKELTIKLAPRLASTVYGHLHGKELRSPADQALRPATEYLQWHHDQTGL